MRVIFHGAQSRYIAAMNELQYALAAEIRAEMASRSPRLTATEMMRRTGIKHASWRNWFVTAKTAVPLPELDAVCDALGIAPSEMMRRAEVRRASMSTTDRLEAMLSPEALAMVREEQARLDHERAGEGDAEDPPSASQGRRRSA
jgi:DNA-binding Xre family transcriptional regulator